VLRENYAYCANHCRASSWKLDSVLKPVTSVWMKVLEMLPFIFESDV
jgi:hypothetical protein